MKNLLNDVEKILTHYEKKGSDEIKVQMTKAELLLIKDLLVERLKK